MKVLAPEAQSCESLLIQAKFSCNLFIYIFQTEPHSKTWLNIFLSKLNIEHVLKNRARYGFNDENKLLNMYLSHNVPVINFIQKLSSSTIWLSVWAAGFPLMTKWLMTKWMRTRCTNFHFTVYKVKRFTSSDVSLPWWRQKQESVWREEIDLKVVMRDIPWQQHRTGGRNGRHAQTPWMTITPFIPLYYFLCLCLVLHGTNWVCNFYFMRQPRKKREEEQTHLSLIQYSI